MCNLPDELSIFPLAREESEEHKGRQLEESRKVRSKRVRVKSCDGMQLWFDILILSPSCAELMKRCVSGQAGYLVFTSLTLAQ